MYTHSCIKCQAAYQDEEIDAYYCAACVEQKKAIARDLDRKFPTTNQEPHSELTAFESDAKVLNTPDGRKAYFIKG